MSNGAANTITVNVGPDGAYNYTIFCFDTDGNFDYDSFSIFTVDTAAPNVASNVTGAVTTYSPTTPSVFNVTWTDTNGINSSVVVIEGNWSGAAYNYTPNLFGSVFIQRHATSRRILLEVVCNGQRRQLEHHRAMGFHN